MRANIARTARGSLMPGGARACERIARQARAARKPPLEIAAGAGPVSPRRSALAELARLAGGTLLAEEVRQDGRVRNADGLEARDEGIGVDAFERAAGHVEH